MSRFSNAKGEFPNLPRARTFLLPRLPWYPSATGNAPTPSVRRRVRRRLNIVQRSKLDVNKNKKGGGVGAGPGERKRKSLDTVALAPHTHTRIWQ